MIKCEAFSGPHACFFFNFTTIYKSSPNPQDETEHPGNCPSNRSNKAQSLPLSVGLHYGKFSERNSNYFVEGGRGKKRGTEDRI